MSEIKDLCAQWVTSPEDLECDDSGWIGNLFRRVKFQHYCGGAITLCDMSPSEKTENQRKVNSSYQ